MKKTFITVVLILAAFSLNAQEKKIDFKNGTVEICTSAKMSISGYNGDQVIIKNLSPKSLYVINTNNNNTYGINSLRTDTLTIKRGQTNSNIFTQDSISDLYFSIRGKDKKDKAKGLTPLGSTADEDSTPIDQNFDILLQGNHLIIRDKEYDSKGNVFFYANSTYEILVPNSVKLNVSTGKCGKSSTQNFVFSSEAFKIENFEGDLQVSSQYKALELKDVDGPVLVNTLGADIKVVFDKKRPDEFFSIISNDGDIDITMPQLSKVSANITGQEVLSNLDFKILTENFINEQKKIIAELNGGGTKFDIKTEYGTVYLRKK